jgi:hypothetical protein
MAMMPNDDDQQEAPLDADGNPVQDSDSFTLPEQGDDSEQSALSVEENDDGSATVTLPGEKAKPQAKEFYENLADGIVPEDKLTKIANELIDLVERDQKAREERDKQYAEGIKRTGLGGEAPGGAEFSGASKAVHPVLIEGCIDFSARAMKELVPAQGPVRTKIVGKSTPAKVDKAERKRQYMNWQLTKKIPEYKPETEKMLTQLPMGGSQYKKWWYDENKKRPCMEFVPIDNIFLPFAANSFYTAERITHWQQITEECFEDRMSSGFYRDIDNMGAPGMVDESRAEMATQKVEGATPDGFNTDGLRDVYEVSYFDNFVEDTYCEDERKVPYIIHIDKSSGKVLALYRNWDQDDEQYERLHWIIENVFIPWRGIYGLGLPHIIGSLSGAITGAIRAILDNALAQTRMGGLRLKGGRGSGATVQGNPTEFTELDSGTAGNQDDIRKIAMFQPINQMSPVLFSVVQWLTDQAKGVLTVANEKIADAKSDMPMGTALALIEQGSITFSAIHMRLHEAQARELEVLHRLNCWFLEDTEVVEELGDLVVSRSDFEGPMDIIPVSDPNIFSETQRYAQMQAVIGLMGSPLFLPMFKPDKVLDRALQLMNVPNREELLNIKPEAEDLDPVSENMMVGLGEQPIKPFLPQDHMSHLKVHLSFATSPLFGGDPMHGPKILMPLMDHVFQHIVQFYAKHMHAAQLATKATGTAPEGTTPDGEFAEADQVVQQQLQKEMQAIAPLLQQAQKMAQQAQQQAQQAAAAADPQAQVGMADVKRKKAYDDADLKMKQQKMSDDKTHQAAQMQAQQSAQRASDASKTHTELLVQAAKDARERMEQQAKDQREKDKLHFEQQRAQLQAHTDMAVAALKEHLNSQNEQHATQMKALTDLVSTHLQHNRESEANEAKAENDRISADNKPVKNFAEGGHVLPWGKEVNTSGDASMAFAITKLGQAMEDMARQQTATNQRLADTLADAMELNREEMRVLSAAASATAQGNHTVAESFRKLDSTMRAPRKRVLKKDKNGGKTVVDKIDDGSDD